MPIRQSFQYECSPTKEQQALLAIQFGHSRFAFNWALQQRQHQYKQHQHTLSYYDNAEQLTQLKKQPEFEWLTQAHSQVLQAKLKDLDQAYKNFFAGRARFPRFKSKHHKQTIRYPQGFKFQSQSIFFPKIGWVKTKFHRSFQGTAKNITVSKTKSGRYLVSVQCEMDLYGPFPLRPAVGIDLGLKDFLTLSTGEKVDTPKYLRKAERKQKRLQRRLAQKKKASHNRHKARQRLARHAEHVANQRKDFHHKLSHRLVNEFGVLKFEDLHVKGMVKNHCLSKSIHDAGWSQFVQFCEYKAIWNGAEVQKVDRWFPSSTLCSTCGEKKSSLELKERMWTCDACGSTHDRDVNAALNILRAPTAGAAER